MNTEKKCFNADCLGYGLTVQTVAQSITDMHSHVLPEMDDGADSVDTALAMLSEAYRQGVRAMVASSHFYADRESPDEFLARREQAVEKLIRGGYDPEGKHPKLYLGAEVAFFSGMARSPQLDRLTIGGGKGILVEMPFEKWSDGVISEVLEIRESRGLRPIIAHIERYIDYQKGSVLGRLIEGGVIIQSNAENFIEKKTAKKAIKLLYRGGIHLLGSDAHGLTERAPVLGECIEIILRHKYGEAMLSDIADGSRYILKKAESLGVAPLIPQEA